MLLARLAGVGAVPALPVRRDERARGAAGDISVSDSENHRVIRIEMR